MTNNLKQIMQDKGISIDHLSKMAGVTSVTIQNWRKAKKMKLQTQEKICKLLKLNVTDVFKI